MIADVVVDIGNTRIKWGRCAHQEVVESVSLPGEDPKAWEEQFRLWNLDRSTWVVSAVQPHRQEALVQWLSSRGQRLEILNDWHRLDLRVLVERPEGVGIDRLLNVVAANSRRTEKTPAVIVDAGSAVTVDWVDEDGAFGGGAILPGVRLMAKALHEHTALLPLIELPTPLPAVPGPSTPAAIECGIYWTVVGGIQRLVAQLSASASRHPHVWLTGGDAALLAPALEAMSWPTMTLEGIRRAAERLP